MKLVFCAAALLTLSSAASGYYHFIRYSTGVGPFVPIYEKFDLDALPNKTVSFFIREQNGLNFAPNDSFAGFVSQIRAAARVWDEVETSDLRIAFGGMAPPGAVQSSPSIEIIFEELAPGIVAAGAPTVRSEFNGAFVPVLKSVVILRSDLTTRPSYTEAFFGTMVHEFGHALGLQHSLASAAMSTGITRATTRARPLTADDVAGISLLYPRRLAEGTGSISGRVRLGGNGVSLASVVALSPNGPVVSTLTNPDGTYRIEGLPPSLYLLYVHPLPPPRTGETRPANIVFPLDPDNREIPPSGAFETLFYPSTKEPQQALPIQVTAGGARDGVDFAVTGRGSVPLHSVETYAFPANLAVKPPYIGAASSRFFLVAGGAGLVSGGGPIPGLQVRVIGGSQLGVQPYSPAPGSFVQLDVDPRALAFQGEGPRHLLFSANNEIYVLPFGFYQADRMPPSISGLISGPDRAVAISGSGLRAGTRILFDGVAASVRVLDEVAGTMIVTAPPAPRGHRANVVAVNPDGQSSLFVQEPPSYTYDTDTELPSVAVVSPTGIPAGAEILIQVDAPAMNFVDGQSSAGFGSGDLVVRRLWVVSPTRLLLNVAASAAATPGTGTLTLTSGLQFLSQPGGFQILPGNSRTVTLNSSVINADTGQRTLYAGSVATVTVTSAPGSVSSLQLFAFLGDRPAQILAISGNQVTFQIPASTPVGPAVLRLDAGAERGLPVAIEISPPPPQILGLFASITQIVDPNRPARAGEVITLNVSGLGEPGAAISPTRVSVTVGGLNVPVTQVTSQGNIHQVFFLLPQGLGAGPSVPVTVSIGERASASLQLSTTS